MFSQFPREAAAIFGAHATLDTPEGLAAVLRRKLDLAVRIDMCASQVLGLALTFVKTMCVLAALEGGAYLLVLARSLKIGFLVNLQSMLSTAGNENGMIDDLDCAALWLDLVRVRLVCVKTAHAEALDPGEEVEIHRDGFGRIIVDLQVGEAVAAAVQAALESMDSYVPECDREDILGADTEQDGVEAEPVTKTEDGRRVLATTSLYGVAFTQGVNEMQFVVNTFVPLEARHQADINLESLSRLGLYFSRYRHALRHQLYRLELGAFDGRLTTLSSRGEIALHALPGTSSGELDTCRRAVKMINKILDESDRLV
jgi:hypothetical protein